MKLLLPIWMAATLSFVFVAEGCKPKEKLSRTEKGTETESVAEEPGGETTSTPSDLELILSGYQHLTTRDLDGRTITLDGEAIPVYDARGERLRGNDIIAMFQDDEMDYQIYGTADLEPKLAVFRKKSDIIVESPSPPPPPQGGFSPGGLETVLEFAPPFRQLDMDGEMVELEKLKGRVVVINFWFTRCQPCIDEMPELNSLVGKYKDEDVEFLGITFEGRAEVSAFLKKQAFNYRILPNAQKVTDDYIVMGFPTNIVLDRKGDIQWQGAGYRSEIDRRLSEQIDLALTQ